MSLEGDREKVALPQDFVDFSLNEVRIPVINTNDYYPVV
jgi:hypothetical protein